MSGERWNRLVAHMRDFNEDYDTDEIDSCVPQPHEEQGEAAAVPVWFRREIIAVTEERDRLRVSLEHAAALCRDRAATIRASGASPDAADELYDIAREIAPGDGR